MSRLIVREPVRLLNDPEHYQRMSQTTNPYGDGQACRRVAEALQRFAFGMSDSRAAKQKRAGY